jgi:hypothetical protein
MPTLRSFGYVPVSLQKLRAAMIGWRDLLTSGAADISIAADGGLLPDLRSAE